MALGKKYGGRKKGTPNKLTACVREAFQEAFNAIQGNQDQNLIQWGLRNPTEFYKLASKLIPIATELTGKDGAPIKIMDDTQAAAKLAAILNAAQARKEKGEKV